MRAVRRSRLGDDLSQEDVDDRCVELSPGGRSKVSLRLFRAHLRAMRTVGSAISSPSQRATETNRVAPGPAVAYPIGSGS